MREYRAQLDADRAAKLSKGTNHADLRSNGDGGKDKVVSFVARRPMHSVVQVLPVRECVLQKQLWAYCSTACITKVYHRRNALVACMCVIFACIICLA